jgi:hypothetical protein
MTCRIRAGEVARPRCGFTPRAARHGHPCRRPVVLGSSTPADPLLSTGHPDGGRTRRPPGSPRRGGGGLSSVTDLGSRMSENPNGTGDLWRYSPLIRSGGHCSVRTSVEATEDARTSTGTSLSGEGLASLRNPDGPTAGDTTTPKGGTSFGPFRLRSGRLDAIAEWPDRAHLRQLSERGGSVTRAVRRSPSSTRSARQRGAVHLALAPLMHRLGDQRLGGARMRVSSSGRAARSLARPSTGFRPAGSSGGGAPGP